jgi:hypothetical protein
MFQTAASSIDGFAKTNSKRVRQRKMMALLQDAAPLSPRRIEKEARYLFIDGACSRACSRLITAQSSEQLWPTSISLKLAAEPP